jgi:hypothetical protein
MIDRHADRGLAVFAGRTERHDVSVLIDAGLAFFSDGVPFGQPPQDRRLVYPDVVSLQKNDELAKPAAKRDLGRGEPLMYREPRKTQIYDFVFPLLTYCRSYCAGGSGL